MSNGVANLIAATADKLIVAAQFSEVVNHAPHFCSANFPGPECPPLAAGEFSRQDKATRLTAKPQGGAWVGDQGPKDDLFTYPTGAPNGTTMKQAKEIVNRYSNIPDVGNPKTPDRSSVYPPKVDGTAAYFVVYSC